jgi:hypothetical protein
MYVEYKHDPFFIRQGYRHLFAVPLTRRLQQDRDCLQCFLSTMDLAIEERKQFLEFQSERARRFFFPRSLPKMVQIDTDTNSWMSGLTDISKRSQRSKSSSVGNLDEVGTGKSLDCDALSLSNCSSIGSVTGCPPQIALL